ncbi:MAG: hypothetical protein ACK6DG_01725 [Cyanobacteriota bacterium]
MAMLALIGTPLLFFLSTPGWGLPELPALPELPSLNSVLPNLNGVVPREGQVEQLDTKERAVQGQVQMLDQTTQVVPSSDGSNGRILSLDQSLETPSSPEGLTKGSGYTPGTYTNVDLTGGSGSGAKGTVVVGSDGRVQSVALTSFGHGYQASDALTASSANLGGSGSGFAVDVSKVVSRGSPEGLGPGSGYTPGTYTDVPLTGGSGTGAKATVVVGSDGKVQLVALSDQGRDYQASDRLSANTADLGGGAGSGFNVDIKRVTPTSTAEGLDPGKGYKPGTYTDVPLSSGSGGGSGAKATVVVGDDGTVSSVSLTAFGKNYEGGDSLSTSDTNLGGSGGSGFSVDVSNVRSTLPSLDDVLKNVLPSLGN